MLLSDGQHNWGSRRSKKAIEMGEHKLPIYPVPLGATQPPPDVAVVSVKAPAAVFKDVDTQVEARFKVSGIKGRKQIVVQLQRPDEDAARRNHRPRRQRPLSTPSASRCGWTRPARRR